MPKRVLAPAPHPFVIPNKTGLPQEVADAFTKLEQHLKALNVHVRSIFTPQGMPVPDGPLNPTVSQLGGTLLVDFQADQSGPYISVYRVYRATAGTRSAPTTPGPDQATCVGVIPANRPEDAGHIQWMDRNFTIPQLDPANPTRFAYWVTSVDDLDRQSIFVPCASSPIETLVTGPGDHSPEPKFTALNKLLNAAPTRNDGLTTPINIDQPFAITSSTNAAPIVVTIGAHDFVVGDFVAVDSHLVNTNANGWWKVSAVVANVSITLVNPLTGANSIGNGVGAATGKLYRVSQILGGLPPYTHPTCAVANGNTVDWTSPWSTNMGAVTGPLNCLRFVPWYSNQATLAQTPAPGGAVGASFYLPDGGAGTTVAIAQEVGLRGFPNSSPRVTLSLFAYWVSNPANSVLTLDIVDPSLAVLLTTNFSPTLNPAKFVYNFAIPNSTFSTGRIKFRIKNTNVSGVGSGLVVFAPMVACGDVAPAFSAMVDSTDYSAALSSDLFMGTWARTIQQTITRDASAPYA